MDHVVQPQPASTPQWTHTICAGWTSSLGLVGAAWGVEGAGHALAVREREIEVAGDLRRVGGGDVDDAVGRGPEPAKLHVASYWS